MKIDGLKPKDYQHMMSPLPMGKKDADFWKNRKVTASYKVSEFVRIISETIGMVFYRLLNLAFGTHKWETDKSLVRHLSKGIGSAEQLEDQKTVRVTAKIGYSLFLRLGENNDELNALIEALPQDSVAFGQKVKRHEVPSLFENEFQQVENIIRESSEDPPQNLLETFERALLQNPALQKMPRGIPNLGNSCYMNASLQLLFAAADYFETLLQQPIPEGDVDKQKKEKLRGLLLKLLKERTSEAAREFRAALAESGFMWALEDALEGQQDAHEFVTALFNLYHDLAQTDQHALVTSFETVGYETKEDGEVITHKLTPREEILHNLTVEVEGGGNLEKLIEAGLSESHHNDQDNAPYFESANKNLADWERRMRFAKAPEYLLVHLKRFKFNSRGGFSKLNDQVHLPKNGKINLAPFIDPSATEGPCEYELIGKANHHGTFSGGHYTADVKYKGGNWYRCNDRRVDKIETPELGNGYLLLFKRI